MCNFLLIPTLFCSCCICLSQCYKHTDTHTQTHTHTVRDAPIITVWPIIGIGRLLRQYRPIIVYALG